MFQHSLWVSVQGHQVAKYESNPCRGADRVTARLSRRRQAKSSPKYWRKRGCLKYDNHGKIIAKSLENHWKYHDWKFIGKSLENHWKIIVNIGNIMTENESKWLKIYQFLSAPQNTVPNTRDRCFWLLPCSLLAGLQPWRTQPICGTSLFRPIWIKWLLALLQRRQSILFLRTLLQEKTMVSEHIISSNIC